MVWYNSRNNPNGYSKLPELLAAFPNKYQIKRYEGKGGATIIAYKCL